MNDNDFLPQIFNTKMSDDFESFVNSLAESKFEIWLTLQNYGIIEKRVF